jgi:hypothetical protein
MTLEISELLLPAIVIQILQSIKELVCHTFDKKKMYPKTSSGNTRPIAASNSSVAARLEDNLSMHSWPLLILSMC